MTDPHTNEPAETDFTAGEPGSASDAERALNEPAEPATETGPSAQADPPRKPHRFSFEGSGEELFGVYIVGILLSAVTLSVYYPWFRAAVLRYVYEKTEFVGSRWSFIGSGREMFVGYIKFLVIIGTLFACYFGGIFFQTQGDFSTGGALFMLFGIGFMLLRPLAVHGALRYRLSRSVWRGIHAGYQGKLGELFGLMIGGGLLSSITLGVYYPAFMTNLWGYLLRNIRLGSVRPEFSGTSDGFWKFYRPLYVTLVVGFIAFFSLIVVGAAMSTVATTDSSNGDPSVIGGVMALVVITMMAVLIFGLIFFFQYQAGLYNWLVRSTTLVNEADGRRYALKANFTAGDVFGLALVNSLLLSITFGLAFPWIIVRNLEFAFQRIGVEGSFDPDTITQTQAPESDATGEGLLDFFDIGIA